MTRRIHYEHASTATIYEPELPGDPGVGQPVGDDWELVCTTAVPYYPGATTVVLVRDWKRAIARTGARKGK